MNHPNLMFNAQACINNSKNRGLYTSSRANIPNKFHHCNNGQFVFIDTLRGQLKDNKLLLSSQSYPCLS